ncbi:MAG: type VI secretion system tube protein Hcp [Luteitalea sp.]|nr:type VI secretion system tube protein Hcp [Luteitalea sp.]
MAQVDYFLKIDGVEAESTDSKHKGEIDLESWSWGATNSGSAGRAGGAGAGKVQPQDFSFVKKLDKSSAKLFMACNTGEHCKSAVLTARKAGGDQQEYYKMTMEECLVSSYQIGGSGGDVVPTEQVTLNFAKLEVSYKEQKADGSLGGEVKQKYDFAANVKI